MNASHNPPIRILLVDDHRSILWGLEKLIESARPRMDVVGTATSTAEAIGLTRKHSPDVILLDMDLAGESSVDAIPELIAAARARVLVLTGVRDTAAHDRAVLAGARGVVGKGEPAEAILSTIEKIHDGQLWLNRAATSRIFMEFSRRSSNQPMNPEERRIATLTDRERDIVCVMSAHASTPAKDVAGLLRISEHTLRNHLTSIYGKLGVASRLELFDYAHKRGLDKAAPGTLMAETDG
ncbi:MAG: response regulator transcription factor [Gammaproteobacteria bacterium]|nr:response regulator transcription factor [Gammaproteobacteria bacterium]